jgi:putative FmdB family regulatory protein
MPIYEYRCQKCRRRVSVFLRSFAEIETAKPKCTYCGHDQLRRLVSRVSIVKSEEARLDSMADDPALGDVDENDPRSVARWMKKMSSEVGEEMPSEFNEAIDRMESGQSFEEIEKSMPELGGMAEGGPGGDLADDF